MDVARPQDMDSKDAPTAGDGGPGGPPTPREQQSPAPNGEEPRNRHQDVPVSGRTSPATTDSSQGETDRGMVAPERPLHEGGLWSVMEQKAHRMDEGGTDDDDDGGGDDDDDDDGLSPDPYGLSHAHADSSSSTSSSSSDNRLTRSIKDITAYGRSKLKKHITQRGKHKRRKQRASMHGHSSSSVSSSSSDEGGSSPPSVYWEDPSPSPSPRRKDQRRSGPGLRARRKDKHRKEQAKPLKRVSYFIDGETVGHSGHSSRLATGRDCQFGYESDYDSDEPPPSPPAEKGSCHHRLL